jgi:hypothetical protein
MSPFVGFLARGCTTVALYAALLWVSGFFRGSERAFAREMQARLRQRPAPAPSASIIDAS